MIAIKPLERAVELQTPQRIRKYVLLWCAAGAAVVRVDDGVFALTPNSVLTITSGQIHYLLENQAAQGFSLEFTYDFFCHNDNDIELIFHNGLFCHFALNEVVWLGENETVAAELKLIEQELAQQPYQYLISIHSRIKLILVALNREKLKQGGEIYQPDALFLKFLEAIRANFDKKMAVRDLASGLQTTEAKLNELAKRHTGRTAQSVIYGLLAAEAKRLLTYENLSVKEVASRLGFDDPFYFSNFFKKQTHLSPTAYKVAFS